MGGGRRRERERSRRNDVAHGCPGRGRERDLRRDKRDAAAPFSRGSPDVTVALFNYSHAYARRCAADDDDDDDDDDDVRHPYRPRDSTYAPHYVLRVCPPTGRTNHARARDQEESSERRTTRPVSIGAPFESPEGDPRDRRRLADHRRDVCSLKIVIASRIFTPAFFFRRVASVMCG